MDAEGIIFVLDASDKARACVARDELQMMLENKSELINLLHSAYSFIVAVIYFDLELNFVVPHYPKLHVTNTKKNPFKI